MGDAGRTAMKAHALIVTQTKYDHWQSLEAAASSAVSLAADLGNSEYKIGDAQLITGGTANEIRKNLTAWIKGLPAGSRAVALWTGHGKNELGKHYLICRDTPKDSIDFDNAVDTASIGTVIAQSKARSILLIVDSCHAGLGTNDIVKELDKALGTQAPNKQFSFAILASAHGLEKAKDNIFLSALRDALLHPQLSPEQRRWTDNSEYIKPDDLSDACIALMPKDFSNPQFRAGGSQAEILPNPRYRAGLPAQNVEERTWRLSASEAAAPLNLAARGVEIGEQGWYFTGRERIQTELINWLNGRGFGLCIVTGPAGSGKSAVIGRIVLLSDDEYRRRLVEAGELSPDERNLPPLGIIDVAIHAKGKTLDECARALCKALRIELPEVDAVRADEVLAKIIALDRPAITVVFDALDEAAEGHSATIASDLIGPLTHIRAVRVLVGTRRSLDGSVVPKTEERHERLRKAFGHEALIYDLDDEPASEDDIREYVYRRLLDAEPLRKNGPDWLASIAGRVAAHSNGVFLYARIVSRTIRERGDIEGELPSTALAAFEQDLRARFEGSETRVNDLLQALAWAEGQGLSRHVWAAVASASSRETIEYSDADVAWVLGRAGWHIVEAGEDGQAVYRLAHQSLADHYQSGRGAAVVQARIVSVLGGTITGEQWLEADRYLWRYLADHAAKAGLLHKLIGDAGFLAVADPVRLAQLIWNEPRGESWRAGEIYSRISDRLIGRTPAERLPLIHLTAQMEDPEFAVELAPPVPVAWRCRWARVRPTAPHRVIGHHHAEVGGVAFGEIDGRPTVVSLDQLGSLRLWDARNGLAVGSLLQVHRAESEPLTGFRAQAVALSSLNDRPVIVAISGGAVSLFDVRKGEWLKKDKYPSNALYVLSVGTVDGRPVCLAADRARKIRLYDALELAPIGPAIDIRLGLFNAIAIGELFDHTAIVVATTDGRIRVFDANTGQALWRRSPVIDLRCGAIALATLHQPFIARGCLDNAIRLCDGVTGQNVGAPVSGHAGWVKSAAFGLLDNRLILLSGATDQTVRLWDLGMLNTATDVDANLHVQDVSAVAAANASGKPMVVSASSDGIRLWDGKTGRHIKKFHESPVRRFIETVRKAWSRRKNSNRGRSYGEINAIAIGDVRGKTIVVEARDDHTIRRWDAQTGAQSGLALLGHTSSIRSVAISGNSRDTLIVSSSFDGTVRLWRPDSSATKMRTLLEGRENVHEAAFGELAGRSIVVSAGSPHTIKVFDTITGEAIGNDLTTDWYWFNAMALGSLAGRPVVAGGDQNGLVWLWMLDTRTPIGEPLGRHADGVSAIAFCERDSRLFLFSAGWDRSIRIWEVQSNGAIPIDTIAIQDGVSSLASDGNGGVVVGLNRGVLIIDPDA